MRLHTNHLAAVRTAARVATLVGLAATLGACASIPKRAWANGEAMSQSRAYQQILNGDNSFSTRRQLESTMNPLRLNYREVAYPGFPKGGTWW
jgi:hypothetical protein